MDDDAHKALVNAQGVAFATLAVLLHRKGALEIDGLATILGLQSVMAAQTSELESEILGVWAAYLEDAAGTVASVGYGADESDGPTSSH